MAEGDDENKYLDPTEAEYKTTRMLGPVRSDTEGKPKAGIISDPSVKSKGPGHSSKTSESPESSMSPVETVRKSPKKEKSKTVVRINPEPFVKELMKFKRAPYSEPPAIPYEKRYEWKKCFLLSL